MDCDYNQDMSFQNDDNDIIKQHDFYNDHITCRSFDVIDFESACKAFTLSTLNGLPDTNYWLHRASMYYLAEKMMDLNITV